MKKKENRDRKNKQNGNRRKGNSCVWGNLKKKRQ